MTAHEWIVDVVEAAATLGYRVEMADWSTSTVRLAQAEIYTGATITISDLALNGAWLLSHLRPVHAYPSETHVLEAVK